MGVRRGRRLWLASTSITTLFPVIPDQSRHRSLRTIFRSGLLIALPVTGACLWQSPALAQSTWNNPSQTTNWEDGGNWSGGLPPFSTFGNPAPAGGSVTLVGTYNYNNGFGSSGTTNVTTVNNFNPNFDQYIVTTLNGGGSVINMVTNEIAITGSGVSGAAIFNGGGPAFENSSTAGTSVDVYNGGAQFFNTSNAGTAIITNGSFNNSSSAQSATLNGGATFINTATAGNATINANGGGTSTFNNTSTLGNAALKISAGSGTIFFDSSIAGTSSASITVAGSLYLNSTDTTGAATVTVSSGGTLGGYSGALGNTTIQAGGTYAPMLSSLPAPFGGVLPSGQIITINGNLTVASGATYNQSLDSTFGFGFDTTTNVTGTANISGATLTLTPLSNSGYTNGETIPILVASSLVGRFGPLNLDPGGWGGLVPKVTYQNNEVIVTLGSPTCSGGASITWCGTQDSFWGTPQNWSTSNTPVATDVPIFNASASTMSVSIAQATGVAGMQVTSSGYVFNVNANFTVGSSGVTGAPTFNVSGANLTFNNGDAGSSVINVGANGGTGTLLFTGSASAASAQIALNANGVLDISGLSLGTSSLSTTLTNGAGNILLGSKTLYLGGSNLTLSGVISDGGQFGGSGGVLNWSGGNTLTLTGANTFTGGVTLTGSAGTTIVVGNNTALGFGTLTMTSGTTLAFNNTGYTITNPLAIAGNVSIGLTGNQQETLSGVIADGSSAGTLTLTGLGTVILGGSNTYSGGTMIINSTAQMTLPALSTTSSSFGMGNINIIGGTLQSLTGGTLNNNIGLGVGGATIQVNAGALTLNGQLYDYNTSGSLIATGAGTVQLAASNTFSGGISVANGIVELYGTNSPTLGAGNVTLVNKAATLEFSQSGTYTYAGAISGSGTVWQSGYLSGLTYSGETVLSGTNTYSGGTLITGGTLQVLNSNAVGMGQITLKGIIGSGATFQAGAAGMTISNPIAIDGSSAGVATIDPQAYGLTLSGTITDGTSPGSLTIAGTAPVILTGTGNNWTGPTTINAGATLQIGNGVNGGSISPTSNITDNGTLSFVQPANTTLTYAGGLSGRGTLSYQGTGGTLQLSGASTFSGGTNLISGTLVIGNNSALGTGSLLMSAGTTLSFVNGVSYTIPNNIVVAGNDFFTPPAGTTQTLSGEIDDAGPASLGIVNMTGTGTLVLSGSSTYSGGTNVTAGTLQVTNNTAVGGRGGGTVGTVTLNGGTFQAGAAGLTISAPFAITSTGGGVDTQSYTLTLSGVIANADANDELIKLGSGTLILSNANTYSGGTQVNQGTISVGNNTALGTGNVALYAGTTLQAFTGGLNVSNTIVLNGTGTSTIDTQQYTLTLSGALDNSAGSTGSLTKAGVGTLILTGTSAYTGGTNVSAGTFQAGAANVFAPTSNFTVAANATIDLNNNNQTIGSLAGAGNVTLGSATLTLANAAGIFNGVISDGGNNGKVVITGGMENFASANAYAGGTTLTGGTLQIGNNSSLGTGTVTLNGGTLQASASVTLTNMIAINTAGGSVGVTAGNSLTLSGLIQDGNGPGTLNVSGPGTVIVNTTTNTYSGLTQVAAGKLQLGDGTNAGSTPGDITVANGAALVFNEPSATSISASISGAGAVTQMGPGTAALTGPNNTYTGNTNIVSGTLAFGDGTGNTGGTTGSSVVNIATGATFQINLIGNGTDAYTFSGTMTGHGTFDQAGTGTTILTGNNSNCACATQIDNGTVQVGGNGLQGTLPNGNITNNGLLYFLEPGGTTTTVSGIISGSGELEQTGPNSTVILTAVNTYTGQTTVDTGTLQLGKGAASTGLIIPNASSIALMNGGSLVFDTYTIAGGSITGASNVGYIYTGTISGTGNVEVVQNAAVVLGGNNTYEGTTTVDAGGFLEVDGMLTGTTAVTVGDSGVLAGTGTVGNGSGTVTINADAYLFPGTALKNQFSSLSKASVGNPGTLTIAGNLTMNSGSFLTIATTKTAASSLMVQGQANVGGAVLYFPNSFLNGNSTAGTIANGKLQITFLQASQGIFGTFEQNPIGAFGASVGYADDLAGTSTPTQAFISCPVANGGACLEQVKIFNPVPYSNPNQNNVGNALNNALANDTSPPQQFTNLANLPENQLLGALTSLSGESATGSVQGAFTGASSFLGMMTGSTSGAGGGGGAIGFAPDQEAEFPPEIALAYDTVMKVPPKPASFQQRWTAWASSFGGAATVDGDPAAGSNTVTATTFGFAAGMEYHFSPEAVAGFALASGSSTWGVAQNLGGGRDNFFQAGAYGTKWVGNFYGTAAAAFGSHWMSTNRFAFGGDQLTANFWGQSYAARVEGGYRYAVTPKFDVQPYAALGAQLFHTPGYSENDLTGGGFALSYSPMTATDVRSELGAQLDDMIAYNSMPLTLRARAAWAHDWVSTPSTTALFQALPAASFVVNGAPLPADSLLTSASAELHLTPQWAVQAKFDGQFASGMQSYAGTGTVRYSW
jgi:fibronectin-binding autotransporter adhesin